jgi:hypothetical protein
MKDTITLAELRQTELYRKEQTRPLREFLMENIDVLKLADEVEMWGEDLLALNMKGGIPVVQGAKMLRQQQAEIEALKAENSHLKYEISSGAWNPVPLTDAELSEVYEEVYINYAGKDFPVDLGRAILRKAQENG